MTRVLIIKTGALGDVLRTTAILPGLKAKFPGCRITWATSPAAVDLVRHHPDVDEIVDFDGSAPTAVRETTERLAAVDWTWVISLDDEVGPCTVASGVAPPERISGALVRSDGTLGYTDDTEPWFGMGLLSRSGKVEADARKLANRRTHATIFCEMLDIPIDRPELPSLPLPPGGETTVAPLRSITGVPRIGLNTGAGGRWPSKELPEGRVLELVERLTASTGGDARFLLLGGPGERERNQRLANALSSISPRVIDAGTDHSLAVFAAIVSTCDVVISSDSLAMHIAIARRIPTVAFFAPTSAHEIDLYNRGEKVVSTGADAGSYRPDTDNSTVTAEKIAAATQRVLGAFPPAS